MKISACVLRDVNAPYALEELKLAGPGPHQFLVRIVGVGHCHADLLPRAAAGFGQPPVVVGHEGAGIVEAVGASVRELAVGDHVVLSFDACGTCPDCRDAHPGPLGCGVQTGATAVLEVMRARPDEGTVIGPLAVATGRTITGTMEGDAGPQTFFPRLIQLWCAGRHDALQSREPAKASWLANYS